MNTSNEQSKRAWYKRKLIWVPVIAIAAVAITASIAGQGGDDRQPVQQPAASITATTPTPIPKPAHKPATPTNMKPFGDGTYLVGRDVRPGTWRTDLVGADTCYWERLSSLDGNGLIANDLPVGPAPAVVTILPSDVAFSSNRCGTWTMVMP